MMHYKSDIEKILNFTQNLHSNAGNCSTKYTAKREISEKNFFLRKTGMGKPKVNDEKLSKYAWH